jgi:hypothetical protein
VDADAIYVENQTADDTHTAERVDNENTGLITRIRGNDDDHEEDDDDDDESNGRKGCLRYFLIDSIANYIKGQIDGFVYFHTYAPGYMVFSIWLL